jgi:hypothetical protein
MAMRTSLQGRWRKVAWTARAALLLASGVAGCARQPPRIELAAPEGASPAGFAVAGLGGPELAAFQDLAPADQAGVFEVFVVGDLANPPPIVGDTSLAGQTLRFTPRYALEPGMKYRVVLHRGQLGAPRSSADKSPGGPRSNPDDLAAEFEIPKPLAGPPTTVTHIYPTSDRLPENQLKFYIHFSKSMGRGEAYRHIHLLRADGSEVAAPFLELGEELWDPSLQRFTLLCDPGRVKRGLKPREEAGPVLEEGQDYTLAIDRTWRDAAGRPLADDVRKRFHVGPPDDRPVDPQAWKIVPPPAGTIQPLVVGFSEPLDRALVERMLWVVNSSGDRIAGAVEIDGQETAWRFAPRERWPVGEYRLVVDTALEDLAGNAVGRAFDVDVFGPVQNHVDSKTVSIPFTIGDAAAQSPAAESM